jgi:Protein of unknown function (DUF2490)
MLRKGYTYSAVLFFLLIANAIHAQVPRISETNTIAWFQLNTELQFSKKWGLHVDLNNRRVDFVNANMQGLYRAGINYRLTDRILLRAGFAYVENSPYGTYKANAFEKPFNEKRLFQMISITDKMGSVDISHRLILEQRWIERYSKAELTKPDEKTYANRIRYMLRLQKPFKKTNEQTTFPYLAMYDELFIGFGNEVGANIFDQNRWAILAGYRFSPAVRIEAGYLNQIFQLGRRVNNNNVIQHNNGLQVNLLLNIATQKPKR